MATLLLTLSGPLQSWGTTSRFDERKTDRAPSKSGVVGMIAAAQGRSRDDDIADLAALRMGVRCDRPGQLLIDFHTAGGGDTGGVPVAKGGARRAVVTRRTYLQDAVFLVGLEGEARQLDAINEALRSPRWPLALGRRSCPPLPPVHAPEGPVAAGLEQALRAAAWRGGRERRSSPVTEVALILEDLAGEETVYDQPVGAAFGTRTFAPRRVRRALATPPGETS